MPSVLSESSAKTVLSSDTGTLAGESSDTLWNGQADGDEF